MNQYISQATHLSDEERRINGAHYTSTENILKVINPLFLEDLNSEFESIKNDLEKLHIFHKKISNLKFLDPACGGGNFLIVTYISLLDLEKKIINQLEKYDIAAKNKVNAEQFYGIEIDEQAVNLAFSNFEKLGIGRGAPKITTANALNIDWETVISKDELNYIIGNPPFIGAYNKTEEQKQDMIRVFGKKTKCGLLDYCCAWFKKAAEFMEGTKIETAFVATNSIAQGQQPSVLWGSLSEHGAEINFAHRSFKWGA